MHEPSSSPQLPSGQPNPKHSPAVRSTGNGHQNTTASTGESAQPTTVNTPSTGKSAKPASASTPSTGKSAQPASASNSSTGKSAQPASASTPSTGKSTEPAGVSTPLTGESAEAATASTPSTGESTARPAETLTGDSPLSTPEQPPTGDDTRPRRAASIAEPETVATSVPMEERSIPEELKARQEYFRQLPLMSWQELKERLQAGVSLKDHRLPFLNLAQMTLEHPLVIENCLISGLLARGTHFQGEVRFKDCWFTERVQFSSKKVETLPRTTFAQTLQLQHCYFDVALSLRGTEIHGPLLFEQCHSSQPVLFEGTLFHQNVYFEGPGKLELCSFRRATFEQGLSIQNYQFGGHKDISLDLRDTQIKGSFWLNHCRLGQQLNLRKARLGSEKCKAWLVEKCVCAGIDISQARFEHDVECVELTCEGPFQARTPHHTHGQKAGRATVFAQDVAFVDSHFQDSCVFHGSRFGKYLNFKKCLLAQGGNFNQIQCGALVSFWQTKANAPLHFRKAHFQGRVQFGYATLAAKSSFNEAVFEENLALLDCEIQGDIFFSKAYLGKDLKLYRLQINGGLNLSKICVVGNLEITSTVIKDRFILSAARLHGSLQAPDLEIGTWGTLNQSVIMGDTQLPALKVGTQLAGQPLTITDSQGEEIVTGSFYLSRALLYKDLQLNHAKIRGQLSLEECEVHGETGLIAVSCGHDIVLSRGYLRGLLRCDGLQARCLKALLARYKEEVCLDSIKVEQCSLYGSSFDNGLTMRKASITKTLTLNNVDIDGRADLFKCRFGRIFFQDLLADYFIISRDVIGEQLSSEHTGNYQQAQNEYGILKQAFQSRSQYQDMDWAYYRFCRARRKQKQCSWRHPLQSIAILCDWLLLDLGFGYGTRPMNIAGVALVVVVFFGVLFCAVPQGLVRNDGQPLTQLAWSDGLYLSLVTFASMDYGDCQPYFDHWLKHCFSLEGLLGIFLTTLFVATISRKIIRT